MIVCCDIDHTLAHAAWRDEHIEPAMQNGKWDYYHSLNAQDKPATEIVNLLIALHNAGHEIYIVTARPRKWLRQTYSWLHKHGILVDEAHILMRPFGDANYRPSPEMKLELVNHLKVDLMIEDREDVCKAFAEVGIATLMVRLVS
jgi:phosphoglycolate phosphatase-like HAD superfamily hydrolase